MHGLTKFHQAGGDFQRRMLKRYKIQVGKDSKFSMASMIERLCIFLKWRLYPHHENWLQLCSQIGSIQCCLDIFLKIGYASE
jgi:hypothetical protein